MRHRRKGKKLNRDVSHRKALYRNLTISLIEHGSIETTLAKAKAARPFVERLVTVAKKGDLASRRRLISSLGGENPAEKLLSEIGPRFKKRPGGYTRIVKLGPRASDKAEMARIEWVEEK